MTESYIRYGKTTTTLVGPDATEFARAATLGHSLKLYVKTRIKPIRGVGITQMLQMATRYTGRKYKRSEAAQAAEDVLQWAMEMKAALPKLDEEGRTI
ncbi:MAG: hypothetical protein J2P48_08370 [Alphaproteobacteria bacterium]|nr:hypothetical protein [Alphaproteobacteria bacterium]